MLAIETHYLGPTNYRGSRVKASVCESSRPGEPQRTLTLDWDDALNCDANHMTAARTLARKLTWRGTWVQGATDRGYIFVQTRGQDSFTV